MRLFSRSKKNEAPASRSAGHGGEHAETDESPVTEERSGLFVLHDCPSSEKEAIDIVAVHGLGGHWKQTWIGASDRLWLRDFLPGQLSDSGIKSRIISYGYDSDTAFSKSVTDIDDAAIMLLDRLEGDRQSVEEKGRPVVFIAHSLGGIVVKKALILAHERSNYYGHLLRHARAVVFLGVPHRGADAAYWANLAARLLQFGQLGFGTNPAYVSALQKNSTTFTNISGQFVERAAPLLIRTFFETEKMGNQLIVDKDSATLRLPNEMAVGVAGSNHRTMCKFDSAESQKYKPVWVAIRNLAQSALDVGVREQSRPPGNEGMLARTPPQKALFSVPFPKDNKFVDRGSVFTQIEERLRAEHRVALHGIGGAGKSQIAIEFAYRRRRHRPRTYVFWVYAATETRFVQVYQDIVRKLGLPGADTPEVDQCQLLSDWLDEEDEEREWLMILDNVDDRSIFSSSQDTNVPSIVTRTTPRPLTDYLPRRLDARKSLIVTTRNREVGEYLSHGEPCVEVPLFSLEEAVELLQSKLRGSIKQSDPSEVKMLLELLEYLPLAIVQAIAFMNRNQISLSAYVKILEKDEQNMTHHLSTELLDPRRDHEFPNSVFRTWKLSFTQIRSQYPVAAHMLSLMAMLDRQEIPETLLSRQDQNEIEFMDALGTLNGYSLVTKGASERTMVMHRLVQLSVQHWLNEEKQRERYAGDALQLVADTFPTGEHENKKTCEALLPHAQIVLKYDLTSKSNVMHQTTLLHHVGWFEWRQGNYTLAYQCAVDSYEGRRNLFGDDKPETIDSLSFLGSVLRDRGRYEQAEEIHRQALKLRETVLGKEHPDALTSMNNLAVVLRDQGKYEQAEEIHRQALKLRETVLGKEHPDTLTSMNNLGLVLRDQGKYEQAEEIHRQALKLCETVLGKEHPDALTSMNNLAVVLRDQGKYEQAEEIHRQASKLYEMVLGKEHPDTLTSMNNLGLVLWDQGKYEQAEEIHRQALKLYETVLGKEHPDTLTSMNNLGLVLRDQGKYEQAEEIHRQESKLCETVLGKEHPSTLTSMNNLALTLWNQGRLAEAEKLELRVMEIRTRQLGPVHPDTLTSMANLAHIWKSQGRYQKAIDLKRQADRLQREVLGFDHPAVIASTQTLSEWQNEQKTATESVSAEMS